MRRLSKKRAKLKKSQAAMEFLLTYGWAIVIVVVAVSALAYFGVLDFGNLNPSYCHLPVGLSCLDYSYEKGVFTFVIKNNMGKKIYLEKIEATGCDTISKYEYLENSNHITIEIPCIEFKGEIKVYYRNEETGLSHSASSQSSIKDSNEEITSPPIITTYETFCRNANKYNLCNILGDYIGQPDYKQRCCDEWNLCCT